ncbi:DUF559 domain-containing protein [Acinetobacter ursingii]|uniref:DUF559 domain-containing protein n=1 Tax=Acinetobacter ursingii TaxID=108980 RepID=UPI001250476E|nr:DUF559 domain-containing protein [Acinetobacter ursingii]
MSLNRPKAKRMTAAQAVKYMKKHETQVRAQLANVGSIGESVLREHLRIEKIKYVQEFKFSPSNRYRADFYLPDFNVLVEVEGGTRNKSRHTTHEGYSNDLKKYNIAQILGYSRLAFTTEQVNKGDAIKTIKHFIAVTTGQVVVDLSAIKGAAHAIC